MVDVIPSSRSDTDTASVRGFPTQGQPAQAAQAPSPSSRPQELLHGADPAPDLTPLSDVSHQQDTCPACRQGEQDHYSFPDRRSDPAMVNVTASRLVTGPNVQPVD
jgi:hypothetical protein